MDVIIRFLGFLLLQIHIFEALYGPWSLFYNEVATHKITTTWTYRSEMEGLGTSMVFTRKANNIEVVQALEGCNLEVLTTWNTTLTEYTLASILTIC